MCELQRKSVHFGAQSYDTLWLLNGAKRRSTDALHRVFHQRLLPLSELLVKTSQNLNSVSRPYVRKNQRVNYSNEAKTVDSKPIKTSVEAVTVLLCCIRVGCADLSQRRSDSLLPCHFSPAPSPSDPTETLHGRPSREGGKKQKSERSCPSDASHLSSFNGRI